MSHTAMIPYGAFEIKRCYQANFSMGMAAAVVTAFLPLIFAWLFSSEPVRVLDGGPYRDWPDSMIVKIVPPPGIIPREPGIRIYRPAITDVTAGVPLPVDDDSVQPDQPAQLQTRDERARLNGQDGSGNATSEGEGPSSYQGATSFDTTGYIPSPDVFIPHESEPEPINEVLPEYPRLALEAGFTARLLVEAYVDRAGTVKAMRVVSCSRARMGFEEAAMAAGYKIKYRPAIQNGNPVGVWISYKVEFKTMK
jgi:TonB family protein